MELSDAEISIMQKMLEDFSDNLLHHPDEWEPEDVDAFNTLSAKHRAEAKTRGFWWARL